MTGDEIAGVIDEVQPGLDLETRREWIITTLFSAQTAWRSFLR